jgi:DNA-binding NarL/FixJ family response regulator
VFASRSTASTSLVWPSRSCSRCRAAATQGADSRLLAFSAFARLDGVAQHGSAASESAAKPTSRSASSLQTGLPRRRRPPPSSTQRERSPNERNAIDTSGRLGASLWDEGATAELRATGETARKREPNTFTQLTPQQMQIVRVVADGATNKDMVSQLF